MISIFRFLLQTSTVLQETDGLKVLEEDIIVTDLKLEYSKILGLQIEY